MTRRLLALVVATCAALAVAVPALAHPLGNFTVNHYAGVEIAGDAIYVRLALDLAEIPTLQEGSEIRRPGYAAALAQRLELRVGGRVVALRPLSHRAKQRPGAGGLPTMRFDAIYRARAHGRTLVFVDHSFSNRIGWREITVRARDGARVVSSSVPGTSRSDELRAYPNALLRSPLDVREASAGFSLGTTVAAEPTIAAVDAPQHESGRFESLIQRGDLSLGVVLVSLLIAAFWGAVHALTPGHGKALVAGYLVGTKGKPRHAFLLGATVTVTHTAGVFALGLVTLVLSRFIVPEQLYPWLTLGSGLLVVIVGASVLRHRFSSRNRGGHHDYRDDHHHHHDHDHDHGHQHRHHTHEDFTSKGIVGVGVAAGLLPCPSALVVLLSAIALHRVGFGLALIAAFSLGLAVTITGIGLVAVLAQRVFVRVSFEGRVVRALPAISALVIMLVGVAITLRAIPSLV